MVRPSALVLPALFSLACSAGGSTGPQAGPPGGKADDPRDCGAEDSNCLDFRSWDVLFTNPLCQTYDYQEEMSTVGGESLSSKPENVYCTWADGEASGAREESPEFRLLQWISDLEEGDELFLAYLSYSNRVVGAALCEAAERGVDVTFVLDKHTDRSRELEACGGTVLIRGHQGSVGFAHNKIFMVNPSAAGPADQDEQFMRLSFGSGNMSSGTVLHHENWHFLEVNRASFFVESHLCLMEALIDPESTNGKPAFRSAMNACRDEIEFVEEDDVQAFFIPAREDSKRIEELIVFGIQNAGSVDIGAHRFSYRVMVDELAARLAGDESFEVRLVADDDLYWLKPADGGEGRKIGPNDFFESEKLDQLSAASDDDGRFEVRYLETDHASHLLHHNKFIIFNDLEGFPDAVVAGSPNLTAAGFDTNLENAYYIEVPAVVGAFRAQFAGFWDGELDRPDGGVAPKATPIHMMPTELVTVSAPEQ